MVFLSAFWTLTYLFCSIQYSNATQLKIPHNFFGKIFIKFIRLIRYFYPKFSFQLLFNIIDYLKCPVFVIISAILFKQKYIIDLTAIISYWSHYFPIWHGFKNENKNFISIIFTGFLLDRITGITMIFAFLLAAKKTGYTSVSITSAMLVGVIKTAIHILFFNNNNYIEAVFFIFFGCLAIYRNRKVLLYICGKSVKKDINFYKIINKKNNKDQDKKEKIVVNNKKYKEKIKHTKKYKNYKKFYQNNQKFKEDDRVYEKIKDNSIKS